jgi:PAS domain S-box-containing protein
MSETFTKVDVYQKYLRGGGELGELTRSYSWSKSILGQPETWPVHLLSAVGMILQSQFPMFLWWGNELIQFYNDAYRPSLGKEGKHPAALGQRGVECWPEIWPVIHPLIEQVMNEGKPYWAEDQLIPIYRNGQLEEVYWTFSYSKVEGPDGHPGGVLVVCTETTDKIHTNRKIQDSINALAASEARLRFMLNDAPVAIAVFTGRDLVIEAANKKVLEVWGKTDKIVGLPLKQGLPELEGQPFLQLLDDVYNTGIPYFGNEVKALLKQNNRLEEVYSNFVYHPIKDEQGRTGSIMMLANIVTEHVLARKKLDQSQTVLQLAIESASIGIWMADLRNGLLELSPRTAALHGIPAGRTITLAESFEMIVPEHRDRIILNLNKAVDARTGFSEEYLINPMNGDAPIWIKANGKAQYSDAGEPLYITGTLLDITEDKEDQQRMHDFIAMASHELKTPLTSITGLTQLLLYTDPEKIDAEKRKMILEKANMQLKKMTSLINGFLNVSELEAGKIQLLKEPVNLSELIRSCISEIGLTKPQRKIIFHAEADSIVNADKDKLESVLLNLFGNALKYSPEGESIDVSCKLSEQEAVVSIADKGSGISDNEQERLFERFYRAKEDRSSRVAGFGIGLYLCKEIVERHGGRIWLQSKKGEGSVFYFAIPVK